MKNKKLIIGCVIAALVLMSCDFGSIFGTGQPSAGSSSSSGGGQAAAAPQATDVPLPTKAPVVTTNMTADLSSAKLSSSDLPSGFKSVDLESMGLNADSLGQSFSGASSTAKVASSSGFMRQSSSSVDLVMDFVMYPFTATEAAAVNKTFEDPVQAEKDFKTGFGSTGDVQMNRDWLNALGDHSIGFNGTMSSGGTKLDIQIIVVMRDNAMEMVLTMNTQDHAAVDILNLAQVLDGKVIDALSH